MLPYTFDNNADYWPAPAKINLFLKIIGQRSDGYHLLQTYFQLLDFGDRLNFNLREDGKIIRHYEIDAIAETDDLCLKAAKLLKNNTQTSLGVDIFLEKIIPIGAGLGGGSSDAATTLVALNHLWQLNLSLTELMKLGLSLGADVPVFIQGQSAFAEGIGEILTPIILPEKYYLIVYPNLFVSTKTIFLDEGLTRDSPPINIANFKAELEGNDCQTIVLKHYPKIRELFEWLSSYGQPQLTGTGSCVFIAIDNQKAGQKILERLPKQWKAFVTKSTYDSPLLKKIS